ncbi:hypothetical protein SAMN05216266_11015 [Amycolatopsis marina]|uniref:Uncharacterized protein n=1 Tax=Amycolatopsis marina TaxID=490629 RepID=A0A1I1ATU9_9PSEU|nr:hypothetical protein SAMN05216266_11015 [Amycolatopsis marina]
MALGVEQTSSPQVVPGRPGCQQIRQRRRQRQVYAALVMVEGTSAGRSDTANGLSTKLEVSGFMVDAGCFESRLGDCPAQAVFFCPHTLRHLPKVGGEVGQRKTLTCQSSSDDTSSAGELGGVIYRAKGCTALMFSAGLSGAINRGECGHTCLLE